MTFKEYLMILVHKDGSDLYLSTGAVPSGKFHGTLKPLQKEMMTPGEVKEIAYSIMNEEQIVEFERELEMNLAISESNIGRFRVNIFRQRNEISMVVRNIKTVLPDINDIGLPPHIVQSNYGKARPSPICRRHRFRKIDFSSRTHRS